VKFRKVQGIERPGGFFDLEQWLDQAPLLVRQLVNAREVGEFRPCPPRIFSFFSSLHLFTHFLLSAIPIIFHPDYLTFFLSVIMSEAKNPAFTNHYSPLSILCIYVMKCSVF
jgi:hypothetical protein